MGRWGLTAVKRRWKEVMLKVTVTVMTVKVWVTMTMTAGTIVTVTVTQLDSLAQT